MDPNSQLYLAHQTRWSDNAREARDFAFTAHARAVARGMRLKSFQILFYFPEINYHIVVSDAAGEKPSAKM